ncbi:hypothetical protein EDC04DRAFT_507925 [Pisolithus marmoratus]|nr:hypothetical protein EDC04DRAFT_507925 [Pisolithus marmoratus]
MGETARRADPPRRYVPQVQCPEVRCTPSGRGVRHQQLRRCPRTRLQALLVVQWPPVSRRRIHTGLASSPSASHPSGKLPPFSTGISSIVTVLDRLKGADSGDAGGSVDVKLCIDDREPVAITIPSSVSGSGLGTMASVSNSSPTLPIVAPLRLSKSPRQTPASSSPLPSPSSIAPSAGVPGSLSPGLPGSYSSLNSPLSLAPPRSISSASSVPSPGLSGSLSPALSLSSGFPGSHSPSPRSPAFPPRTQVHVSSGASTSSSPLPNPYGPGLH